MGKFWTIPIIFMLFWWKFSVAEIRASIMIISVQLYQCRYMVPPNFFFEEHPLHKLKIKSSHICTNSCSVKPAVSTESRSVEMASELWWGAVSVIYIVFPRSPVGQCFCTTDSLSEFETCCDQLEHSALQQQLVFPKQHVSCAHTLSHWQ